MAPSPSLLKRVLRPFLINELETGQSTWYPEIEPRVYAAEQDRVFDEVCAVVDRHPRWTLASDNPDQMRVDVEVRTKTIGWVDDMTVWVEPADADGASVRVRSSSRVGRADFGHNARTIRELFEHLDKRLR